MTTAFTATADKIGWYVEQAADGTGDIVALLFKSGGETDGALTDRATLSAVKSNNTECDFTNYSAGGKVCAAPARAVDATGDRVTLSVESPIVWSNAGGTSNNNVGRIIYCYRPASGSTNAQILPLMATDISATTNGNDLQVSLHADGFAVVSAHS